MKRSAFPFVLGVYGFVKMWRTPDAWQVFLNALER